MSGVREFLVQLSARDALDVRIEVRQGEVVDFALNYRALIEGRWYEVVRYDTAHGYLHKHVHRRDSDEVVALEDPKEAGPPYGAALDRAYDHPKDECRRLRREMADNLDGGN